jgi:hypothetical protein
MKIFIYGENMKKYFFIAFLVLLISGCAHPLNISPDISSLNSGKQLKEKNGKKIIYYFSEDIDKEVITPGGGGDNVKYKPYKELDTGIYKILADHFKSVSMKKNEADQNSNDHDLIAEITISTNSSSSSAFTWPPTLFGVNINAEFSDQKTGVKEKLLAIGEGRAEFSEFKNNFNLSAKRASEDALKKFSAAIAASNFIRTKEVESSSLVKTSETNKETRLRELKRLFDGGLIDQNVYKERQKSILSDGK